MRQIGRLVKQRKQKGGQNHGSDVAGSLSQEGQYTSPEKRFLTVPNPIRRSSATSATTCPQRLG